MPVITAFWALIGKTYTGKNNSEVAHYLYIDEVEEL
jgi:hypothetical protein